jgi:hypothetical protein
MAGAVPLACSLCRGTRAAALHGMELSLRKQHSGRLIVREADGLIPLCNPCLQELLVERPRPVWPALALLAGLLLLWRGNPVLGALAALAGLGGAAAVLRQPGQRTLRRRLRAQVLVYSSVPLDGFEPQDVLEITLERRLSLRYNPDGTVDARMPGHGS